MVPTSSVVVQSMGLSWSYYHIKVMLIMEFHGHWDSSEVLTSLTWLLKFWPETSSSRSWDVIAKAKSLRKRGFHNTAAHVGLPWKWIIEVSTIHVKLSTRGTNNRASELKNRSSCKASSAMPETEEHTAYPWHELIWYKNDSFYAVFGNHCEMAKPASIHSTFMA